MKDHWTGIVNAILYRVQFDRIPDETLARQVAIELVTDPLWSLTVEEEYRALKSGSDNEIILPADTSTRMSEGEIRTFIREIVANMNDLRPWPDRPFIRLPDVRLSEFLSYGTVALVKGSVNDLEVVSRCVFRYSPDFGEHLLIRMNSGTEIGFLHPYGSGLDKTRMVSPTSSDSGRNIVSEVTNSTDFSDDMFIVLR